MISRKKLIFFLIVTLLNNCSFDNKTGIWSGSESEKIRISELEQQQREVIDTEKVFSSKNLFIKEALLSKNIILSKPKKNLSWKMSSLNHQNFIGNIYLSGIDTNFLKKKIGKDKFSISQVRAAPLIFNNNIIFADDTGTVFSINQRGKVNWKKKYL